MRVAIANDTDYGLAGYLWTGDTGRAHRVARDLDVGMVWVNSQNVRHLPTPFGGTKASGIGRDGGPEYSFDFYMETKNIAIAYDTHAIPELGQRPVSRHAHARAQVDELAAAHEQARRHRRADRSGDADVPDMSRSTTRTRSRPPGSSCRLADGATVDGPQDRPHEPGDADDDEDRRARLRCAVRLHVHRVRRDDQRADYLDPKIEVEFAFVLGDTLDRADVTAADVYAATDHIVPALELIDARSYRVHPVDGRTRTVRDTIADNAADAGIVVGTERIAPSDAASGSVALGGRDLQAQRHRRGDRSRCRGARRSGAGRRVAGESAARPRHPVGGRARRSSPDRSPGRSTAGRRRIPRRLRAARRADALRDRWRTIDGATMQLP